MAPRGGFRAEHPITSTPAMPEGGRSISQELHPPQHTLGFLPEREAKSLLEGGAEIYFFFLGGKGGVLHPQKKFTLETEALKGFVKPGFPCDAEFARSGDKKRGGEKIKRRKSPK